MSLGFPKYIDGYYGTPRRISRTPRRYPFAGNGDIVTAEFDATYVVRFGSFTPTARGTVDPENAGFYLIDESKPDIFNGDLCTFTRTYSMIPVQQIAPSSRFITKPDLPGTFPQVSGNSLITQPEQNVARWIYYTQIPVTSDSGPPGAGSYPTGGTFTLTCGGQTTAAIAYNANAATVQSALNALSYVTSRGGVVVSGSYTAGFSIQWNVYPAGSVNAASLTGSSGYTGPATQITNVNRVQFSVKIQPLGAATFTGGTFTLTVLGQTTAPIAYNATPATVKAALEALSNIGSGGIYVIGNLGSGLYIGSTTILNTASSEIGIAFEVSQAAITASGSSLTPTGSTAIISAGVALGGNTGRYVNLKFTGVVLATRLLGTTAAHGITNSDDIILTQGSSFRTLAAGTFTIAGTNSISLTAASGDAFNDSTVITAVGKQNGNSYTAGSKLTRIKRVTDFYLPGVTPGITTSDDIPLPDYEGDSASLLEAIFSGDTDINYEVGELEFWRNGPILMRTRTTLNASTL